MPLVRIDLKAAVTSEDRASIGDAVHRALVETCGVPADDRFQVITTHGDGLIYDPNYLGISRTDGIVFIQIIFNQGRTLEQKQALYKRIAGLLQAERGVRPEDVFISLVEVTKENWSFGNGIAQYAGSAGAPPFGAAKV